MQATPATWQMLMDIKWKNEQKIKMLCGGEELTPQLATQLLATDAPLWNLYGPTETTIWSTTYRVRPDEPLTPIGKPIANTTVYVLDSQLQLVPIGIPGILYIGGAGVAKGYLNKPELTSKYFIPNPFSDNDPVLYNTGDQVKWLSNGNLAYLGRLDSQVKIRGFRVELGEIEACLLNYPGISQAIVLNKTFDLYNNQLIAYFSLSKKNEFNQENLQAYLKTKLFEYMIPSHFVLLEDLPLNINGKIDKKALLAHPIIDTGRQPKSIPTTPEQQQLAHIWAEVLAIHFANLSIDDNFFALGGNSLSAVLTINRINMLFSVNLNVGTLFVFSTIRELEKLIAKSVKFEFDFTSLPTVKENEPQPLLDNQMRVWFFNKLSGNSAVYNIAVAWELKGDLDYSILNSAITDILKRQGAFRTLFLSFHGKPSQVLHSPNLIRFTLKIEELTDLSAEELEDYIKSLAAEPFHLEEDYLFCFRLLKLTKSKHILFICLHHLISDAWSFGVLYRELSRLYKSYHYKISSSLPLLPIQYVDYCAWQNIASPNIVHKRQIEYWKKKLENLSPLELPTDSPRPLIQTYHGNSIHFRVSAEEISVLQNVAKENNITLFVIMLSAFALLLTKYTNQTDIAVGIPLANRKMGFTEDIIGFFINTLIIRLDFSFNYSCADLLKTVHHTVLEAQENSDVFFEKLITSLHLERDQSHNPIFQIMFAFNNAIKDELDFPGIIARPIDIKSNFAHMEFICFLEERKDHVEGYIEYNKNLFSHDTIKKMVDNYMLILKELANKLDSPINDISFLANAEIKTLLHDWNGINKYYPKSKNLIQLFERQVKKYRNKTALIYQNSQLSYQGLNKQANQLAHFILKCGVNTNGYIAVYLKRSIETIISFLAAMKSGNAYIPIDEEAPLSQIKNMLDDAKVSAILTTSEFFEKVEKITHGSGIVVITIDEKIDAISREKQSNLPNSTTHLAYVLYTSGSTGKPKGVQIAHHSLINLMFTMRDEIDFTEKDVMLAITPLTFDLSVPDIYLPLTMGASIILADTSTRFHASKIIQHILEYNVTLMQATPTTWKMLTQSNWKNESRIKIICGGESLKNSLAAQLLATGAPVWNFYGPTETTVWTTCHQIKSIDEQKSVMCIGRPLANIEVFVLNQHEHLTPIGVPGELYIGGEAVGEGYLNDS